jgi:hypothetical protein
MNDQDDIEALALNILGMRFALLLEPLDVGKYPFLREAKYRPGRIVISHPFSTNWGPISWDDGGAHDDLTVQFVRPVTRDPRPSTRAASRGPVCGGKWTTIAKGGGPSCATTRLARCSYRNRLAHGPVSASRKLSRRCWRRRLGRQK